MKKKLKRFTLLLLIGATCVFLCLVLFPRSYNVPKFKVRNTTQYWSLPTGSTIGYTKINASGIKKTTPVIFLQGGPGGPVFDKNINVLRELSKDGYEVYLYDQVGCGHSNRLENINEYTVERHKRDLEEIIKIIGTEKVILIGQSWGAMLAMQYLGGHRDKIEKLILTGPGPILPIKKELEALKAPDSLGLKSPTYTNRQGNEKANNLRTYFVSYCAQNFNLKVAGNEEMDDFAAYLNHELNKSTVYDPSKLSGPKAGYGYYMHIKTVQSFERVPDERTKLKQCPIPLLILKGQYDSIKWGYLTEYLEFFTNHKLVIIPNAGHSIISEQPDLYIETIRNFLKTDSHT